MKKVTQNWAIKVRERSRRILSVLLVIAFVAFLLKFRVIQKAVSTVTGIPEKDLGRWSTNMLLLFGGASLIYAGAMLAIPVVGQLILIAGAAIALIAIVRIYNDMYGDKYKGGKIEGTGPIEGLGF